MSNTFDVVVVGASLAGASAAIRLADGGLRVAMVDKSSFPRRKPCGEGFSAFGLAQLQILGVKDRVLKLPHLPYDGYRITSGRAHSVIRSPWDGSITIQRSVLDAELVTTALERRNITPFLSHRVTRVSPGLVALDDLNLSANAIVMACGGNSTLLEMLPCKIQRSGPCRAGITATFKGAFLEVPQHINILLKKDFEIYCTPLAHGRLNVSILKLVDSSQNLRRLILSNELLLEAFRESSFEGTLELPPLGRTNIGNIRRTSTSASIFLAGDAKEEFDPIGGMGMSHALSSGIQVADAILRCSSGQSQSSDEVGRSSSARAMRTFTTISYRTLIGAKQAPWILPLAASSFSREVLKFFTKGLA